MYLNIFDEPMNTRLVVAVTTFILTVRFLQPNNNWFCFTAKGSAGFFVNNVKGEIGTAFVSPLKDCLFLKSIFVIELLNHDWKVLGFLLAEKLQRGNQMSFDDLVSIGNLCSDRSIFLDFLVLEELRSDSRADKYVNLVVRLQRRSHLLVRNNLDNFTSRSRGILLKILAGALHSKI